jgi:mercuric ion binding protein
MTRRIRIAVAAGVFIVTATTASAELQRVDFKLDGMNCAYCNGAMTAALKKLDGVESVELSPEQGSAVIRLKADNKITLEQLRRLVRSTGYATKDAVIIARGRIVATGGSDAFDLLNGSTLPLAERPAQASDGIVELAGVSRADEKNIERLTVKSIK